MLDTMNINKTNMSQHLSVLKKKGLVFTRRESTIVYYRLASPRTSEGCSIMRDVHEETLREKERIAKQMRTDERNQNCRSKRHT